jgi:hypothetical protein
LIPLCNTADEQAMGDFSKEDFLGVEIKRHRVFEADFQLRSQRSELRATHWSVVTPHRREEKQNHHRQEMVPNRKDHTGERDVIKQELNLHS